MPPLRWPPLPVLALVSVLVLAAVVPAVPVGTATGTTAAGTVSTVDDDGADFRSIRRAVERAGAGDTIRVALVSDE